MAASRVLLVLFYFACRRTYGIALITPLQNVCLFQAHCLKATALTKAGRNDEALQEYFLCVALKPDWTKVKLEAQKVREAL